MVTPELAEFIRIELERNLTPEMIREKLLAVGWNAEDIAEGLTSTKTTTPPVLPVSPTINEPLNEAKPQVKSFDPYRESSSANTTTFKYKTPTAEPLSAELIMPVLRTKSLGDMQNQIANIPQQSTEAIVPPPSLEQYQNKLEQIVVPPVNVSPTGPSFKPAPAHHFMRTLFIIVVIILLLGGGAYSYTKGYIKLPFEIPFLKKDPHQILAQVPNAMAGITSFNSSMDIKATFPQVSKIIEMLMAGDTTPTTDTDIVDIHTTFAYADNQMEMSFLGKSTTSATAVGLDVKNFGDTLFAKISDGQNLLPKDISLPIDWISISKNDIDSLGPLLSNSGIAVPFIGHTDAFLSLLAPTNLNTVFGFMPITASTVIKENPSQKINGVDVYHYSIAVDNAMIEKFVHTVALSYGFKITDEEWLKINKILSATSVDSFEVWIGKSDRYLYKTNIILTVPLTKVLSLEDKNLSENKLKVELTNTYYNFGSQITIPRPESSVPMPQVVDTVQKSMKDASVKSIMQNLTTAFSNLHTVEKVYGPRSNSNGSCTNPAYGSLFSPTGHKKNASEAIALISENIITFISITGEQSVCYSTPSLWAIATPMVSDNTKYLCADSSGSSTVLLAAPTGAVCK